MPTFPGLVHSYRCCPGPEHRPVKEQSGDIFFHKTLQEVEMLSLPSWQGSLPQRSNWFPSLTCRPWDPTYLTSLNTVTWLPGYESLEAAGTEPSLPVTFLSLCMRHIKIVRGKERENIAFLIKAFAWKGERPEFWLYFKAAYIVLCCRAVSYSVIQVAFHPLSEGGSYARGRTLLSTHFNPILFLIKQNWSWVPQGLD